SSVHPKAPNRLCQLRGGLRQVLRCRRELAEGGELMGGGGRRLSRAAGRAVRDRRDFLHPTYDRTHALRLTLRLTRKCRRKLDRRTEVGENRVERALDGRGNAADALGRFTPLAHRVHDPADLTLGL